MPTVAVSPWNVDPMFGRGRTGILLMTIPGSACQVDGNGAIIPSGIDRREENSNPPPRHNPKWQPTAKTPQAAPGKCRGNISPNRPADRPRATTPKTSEHIKNFSDI
ncbi:hypothetical protein GCM10010191_17410 [Actinomadura vinacea]|uniref:Uncharacterized protein n=1 Tax=Actinomadura vinacea TaxID=115336 RepID=A0ABN3INA7_9ACTN